VLARNKRTVFGLLALVVVACGIGVGIVIARQKPASNTVNGMTYRTTTMNVDGQKYTLQIADTPAKQTLGLGQRDNMMPKAGMVFLYAQPAQDLCFWMKDMRFSLDIIWLDAQKQVTLIEPSLSPATYPKTYCPPKPSQYVVEINAGMAGSLGLHQGQKLDFKL
jgi:uncharacterized membrane protein (UPF0127 family)